MSKLPISVCIIAKNEEKYIEECLQRLKPYGFEIVITDTGSTDRTKEIALEYADKVLDFEWVNDFSAARNFCARNATNNWILVLDCDEYVHSIEVEGLRVIMQKHSEDVGVICLKNLVYSVNGETQYSEDNVVRFYNRTFYQFESPVHEQITGKNKSIEKKRRDYILPMMVVHHGYALPPEEMAKKQRRNLDLLRESVKKNGNDPYLYFQIGQSEFVLKNTQAAIEAYEKALELETSMDKVYSEVLLVSLAMSYMRQGRVDAAVDLMAKYEEQCKTARYVYTHANVLYDSGQHLKALLLYIVATTLPDFLSLGESKLHCYESIIELYREFGEEDMAAMFIPKYEQCKKEKEKIING